MTDNEQNRDLANLLNSTTKTVFTTKDFNKFWKYDNYASLIQRLGYLTKTEKLEKIKKGLYSIAGREVNEFELANKLRTPSYVSFETVLYKEGIIFQWNEKINLAGKESIELEVMDWKVVFRQVKDAILLNKKGIRKEHNYYIASPERAVLDMLYINPKFTFDNLRPLDFSEVERLVDIYGRQSMEDVMEELKNYA